MFPTNDASPETSAAVPQFHKRPLRTPTRYRRVATQHGGEVRGRQCPSGFAPDLRTRFLLSFHVGAGGKKYFTQSESSTSEIYFYLRADQLSRACLRLAVSSALRPCTTSAEDTWDRGQSLPGRAEGYCHFTGSPQKVFALPVYVLNIAEHIGHLQLMSKDCYQGLQLSAALTHTCLMSANVKHFF